MILKNILIHEAGAPLVTAGVNYKPDEMVNAVADFNNGLIRGRQGVGEIRNNRFDEIRIKARTPTDRALENMQVEINRVVLRAKNLRVLDVGLVADIEILDNYQGRLVKKWLQDGYPEYVRLADCPVRFTLRTTTDALCELQPPKDKFAIVAIDIIYDPVKVQTERQKRDGIKESETVVSLSKLIN